MQEKYKQIWGVIKNKLGIKFHSEPVYEQKYLKKQTFWVMVHQKKICIILALLE